MAGTADTERGVEKDPGRRRPGRPREPQYDKTILDATIEILFEKGYAGLTIDGVAARTGVGRPTIYRRWASKPALVIAALAQSVGLSPTPDTGVLRDDLLAFQREQVTLMGTPESRRITAGLVADLVADPDLAETYFSEYVEPRRMTVWAALQRGVDRGELRPDADFTFIYDLLLGPLFMRSIVRGEPLEPHLAEQIVDLVLAAFDHPRPPDRRQETSESDAPSSRRRRGPATRSANGDTGDRGSFTMENEL